MGGIRDLLGGNDAPKTPVSGTIRSFGDEEPAFENKKGLKIDNSKSTVKAEPERIDVTANAHRILNDREFQNRLGWNLTARLLAIFKDKKLPENKTKIEKDNEIQVLQDYTQFATLINNDQTQEEGIGSTAFAVAIARCALVQRDQINEQGRMIDILSRKLKALEAEIKTKNK